MRYAHIKELKVIYILFKLGPREASAILILRFLFFEKWKCIFGSYFYKILWAIYVYIRADRTGKRVNKKNTIPQ